MTKEFYTKKVDKKKQKGWNDSYLERMKASGEHQRYTIIKIRKDTIKSINALLDEAKEKNDNVKVGSLLDCLLLHLDKKEVRENFISFLETSFKKVE